MYLYVMAIKIENFTLGRDQQEAKPEIECLEAIISRAAGEGYKPLSIQSRALLPIDRDQE